MRLVPIPTHKYENYRRTAMFECYKWDPQFGDHNTVAPYALVLTREEHEQLAELTEKLDKETRDAEIFLNHHPEVAKSLALPKKLKREIRRLKNYEKDRHVRLMRYDFHPVTDGTWAVSEVNSDVPGGYAESSLLPGAAIDFLGGNGYWYKNFGDRLVQAITKKVSGASAPANKRIMLVHCTSYSDDRQVMQFIGDRLKEEGFSVIYAAADHIRFQKQQAYSILDDNEGKLDAILRFTPIEWLMDIKPKRWQGYFDTDTVSFNHPIAIYAQTKRFPLVWDALERQGISMSTWRQLLPDTLEVKDARGKEGYIFKPVYGRVGENISIKEACKDGEYRKIMTDVKRHPKHYLAQKRFESKPLEGENGQTYHVCLGSYTVEGEHAGYYARISTTPRIDSSAADIPVLICDENVTECKSEECENSKPTFKRRNLNTQNYKKAAYDIWAPEGKLWSNWVRPVPFVSMTEDKKPYSFSEISLPVVENIFCSKENPYCGQNTAVIVDLPGAESVKEGIALAKKGYRPIPLFNGTVEQQGARATVDNQSVGEALLWGASELEKIQIRDDAPPAFLLDSNRLHRFKMEIPLFDNSWDIYPHDMPSAQYLKNHGIENIVLISNVISKDLRKILYTYQKKGIKIVCTKGYDVPKKAWIRKPLYMLEGESWVGDD